MQTSLVFSKNKLKINKQSGQAKPFRSQRPLRVKASSTTASYIAPSSRTGATELQALEHYSQVKKNTSPKFQM